ncbi:MAG: hypothetical protein IKN38_03690 [Clostridia bacterium]|nr:hypothetical protein [Clostridia bacterium]
MKHGLILRIISAAAALLLCLPQCFIPAAASEDVVTVSFNAPSCITRFSGVHSLAVSFSEGDGSVLTAVAGDDPFVSVSFEDDDISADDYKYVALTYRVPVTDSMTATTTELFMCAGDIAGATPGCSVQFHPERGYKYRSYIVDMSAVSYWSGKIHSIRLDSFTSGAVWDAFYIYSVSFCRDGDSASRAANDCRRRADGMLADIDEAKLSRTYYDLAMYTEPYWNGNVVYNEAVYPLREPGGSMLPIRLMYDAKRVVSVRNSELNVEYKYGADYTTDEDGRLVIAPSGAIATIPYTDYIRNTKPSQDASKWMDTRDGRYMYFSETGDLHRSQLAVTYVHEDDWTGAVPESKLDLLPKSAAALSEKRAMNVVFIGDSVTFGCNASSMSNINSRPFMPTYPEMTITALKAKYGYSSINYINTAVGGTTSSWGADETPSRVVANAPDLVFIGFGTNDGTILVAPSDYKANIKSIIDTTRSSYPNAEFVLISPSVINPITHFYGRQEEYMPILQQIEDEYDGVVFVDMMTMHKSLLERKKYNDMTGNNVNHPNDFLIRMYVQSIMATLSPSDIEEVKKTALRALASYVDLSDYREAEKLTVASILDTFSSRISAAEDSSTVRRELANAKSELDGVKTAAEYEAEELDFTYLKFNTRASLAAVTYRNNVALSLTGEGGFMVAASEGGDPFFRIGYDGKGISASEYKYITLIYKVPDGAVNPTASQVFFTTSTNPYESEDKSVSFSKNVGEWSYITIDLSDKPYWTGTVSSVRIDTFAMYMGSDPVIFHSVRMFKDRSDAESFASSCAYNLNYPPAASEKIDFTKASDRALIAPYIMTKRPGDADENGYISLRDCDAMKRVIAGDLTDYDKDTCDADRDGAVTLKDLSALKAHIAGLEDLLPFEAPTASLSFSDTDGALIAPRGKYSAVTVGLEDVDLTDTIYTISFEYANDGTDTVPVTVALIGDGGESVVCEGSFDAAPSRGEAKVTLTPGDSHGRIASMKISFEGDGIGIVSIGISSVNN